MCGDPRVDVVKAAAKTRTRKQWHAWDHDRELIARHTATVHTRWVEQWPDPRTLAECLAAQHAITKGSDTQNTATVAGILAWLWSRLGPSNPTIAAIAACLAEARALGRRSALQSVTSAGLTIPAATQALDALDAAQAATAVANIAGTLHTSMRARLARIAARITETLGTATTDTLTALLAQQIEDTAWLDLTVATETWRSLSDAAETTYLWAGVTFGSWATAGDGRVCGPCSDLEDQGPMPLESFPDCPAHPRCRCAIEAAAPPDWVMPAGTIADLTDLLAA